MCVRVGVCWVVSLFVLKCVNRLYIAHSSLLLTHIQRGKHIIYKYIHSYAGRLPGMDSAKAVRHSAGLSVCQSASLPLPLFIPFSFALSTLLTPSSNMASSRGSEALGTRFKAQRTNVLKSPHTNRSIHLCALVTTTTSDSAVQAELLLREHTSCFFSLFFVARL